jgi:hypothetical protein
MISTRYGQGITCLIFFAYFQTPRKFTKIILHKAGRTRKEARFMARHKIANYGGKLLGDYEPEKKHELAIKAGQASGEKRRKRRAARDVLLDILHSSSTDKDLANIAKDIGCKRILTSINPTTNTELTINTL